MTEPAKELSDPGAVPELAWLPIDRLSVDEAYQRKLDTPASQRLINRIASGFQWAAFGTVTASPYGSDGWRLLDGQHRVEAARRRGDVPHVPAVVLRLDTAAQAAAFIRANDRVPVSANSLLYARAAAGEEEAAGIMRACDDAGVKITKYAIGAAYAPVGSVSSITSLYAVYRKVGQFELTRGLRLLRQAYPTDRAGLVPPLVIGVPRFAKSRLDRDVVDRLRWIGCERLVSQAQAGRGPMGRADMVVQLLQQARPPVLNAVAGVDRARLMAGR